MGEIWILTKTHPSNLFQGLFRNSLELDRPHTAPSLLQHLSFPSQSFFPLFIQESSLGSARDRSSLKWGFCCRVKTVKKPVVPSKYPRCRWQREQEPTWPVALHFNGPASIAPAARPCGVAPRSQQARALHRILRVCPPGRALVPPCNPAQEELVLGKITMLS